MKLRVSKELHERARACADCIEIRLAEFARRAVLHDSRGTFADVVAPSKLLSATRESSTVITIADLGEPDVVRLALARGVLYAESRNPRPFRTDLREGIDYLVERTA